MKVEFNQSFHQLSRKIYHLSDLVYQNIIMIFTRYCCIDVVDCGIIITLFNSESIKLFRRSQEKIGVKKGSG